MKIQIALNQQSIKEAKKKVLEVKNKIPKMNEYFLSLCCEWIIKKAMWYVENSDIGENVKTDINNHWSYVATANSAKITNDAEQAVFVEFGVGTMGDQIPHDNASSAGYDYNVNNKYYWAYPVNSEEDVDMHKGYQTRIDKNGQLWIITKGSWRVMYAYQAIVDARQELRNPNGEFARMWNEAKMRYIG